MVLSTTLELVNATVISICSQRLDRCVPSHVNVQRPASGIVQYNLPFCPTLPILTKPSGQPYGSTAGSTRAGRFCFVPSAEAEQRQGWKS